MATILSKQNCDDIWNSFNKEEVSLAELKGKLSDHISGAEDLFTGYEDDDVLKKDDYDYFMTVMHRQKCIFELLKAEDTDLTLSVSKDVIRSKVGETQCYTEAEVDAILAEFPDDNVEYEDFSQKCK